jgi:hypothetical protein
MRGSIVVHDLEQCDVSAHHNAAPITYGVTAYTAMLFSSERISQTSSTVECCYCMKMRSCCAVAHKHNDFKYITVTYTMT